MGLVLLVATLGIVVVAVLILVFVGLRNSLVRQRNELGRAWLNLDQLLKQRRDELPRLIGTCRSYLQDGSGLLDSVAAARNSEQKAGNRLERACASRELQQALRNLFTAGDRDSALALDASYRQVKKSILALEERIVSEQARFNEQATVFNLRIERFPGSLAARAAGLELQALFDARDADRS
ncbi:MAG TPA: LemA family protein [Terriglobia bacterium]